MACIGQGVARVFVQFDALEAYRFDILGSLGGIVVFSMLAFLELPPIAWGAIVAVLLVVLLGVAAAAPRPRRGGRGARDPVDWRPTTTGRPTTRSPPSALRRRSSGAVEARDTLTISANNIPHQTAYDVATLLHIQPFYAFPYRHIDRASLDRVLIVGAGNGNDVAVALAQGAKHVDAVEIDPVIQSLGSKYHPSHPYQDPRVTVHIDDGRAFVEGDDGQYDLILFALPDSLTLFAGQGSLRLENYLFTKESMETVQRPAAAGRNLRDVQLLRAVPARSLRQHAGATSTARHRASRWATRWPLGNQAVLTAGAGATRDCSTPWDGARVDSPTDDYPFPYLQARTIPPFYRETLLLMLVASLLLIRVAGGPFRSMVRYTDLAFMGAAFLLLETKNVVQFALLFGTTWFVNSLVFAGVLLSVYLAIEVARHVRLPEPRRALPAPVRPAPRGMARAPGVVAVTRTRCLDSSPQSRWPSDRSSWPTSSSPSASATRRRRPPPSPPTCSVRSSAG